LAAEAAVLILCVDAAISILMVFLKLSAIDKTVVSTTSEVLLSRVRRHKVSTAL